MTAAHEGTCLCGAVTAKILTPQRHFGACHCETCRTWTGGPLLAMDCKNEVSFTGEENISVFSSSEWAERGFCKHCGTNLFYRLKANQHYSIPPGLFKDLGDIQFSDQIFIDSKPDYYQFANETRNMTGEELFAAYEQSS